MRITRVVFVIAVVGLCSFGPTTPSRGYAQDPPDEEARLRQRVQVLESQLQGLLEKYERSAGFRDTEYILRVQKQYEEYYEKALDTQVYTISAIGIILTVLVAFAGRFSFQIFDRQIDYTVRGVAAELRRSFEEKLEGELKILEEKNTHQVSSTVDQLREKITHTIQDMEYENNVRREFDSGLIFAALDQFEDSVGSFRNALELYAANRARGVVTKERGATCISNLFRSLKKSDTNLRHMLLR